MLVRRPSTRSAIAATRRALTAPPDPQQDNPVLSRPGKGGMNVLHPANLWMLRNTFADLSPPQLEWNERSTVKIQRERVTKPRKHNSGGRDGRHFAAAFAGTEAGFQARGEFDSADGVLTVGRRNLRERGGRPPAVRLFEDDLADNGLFIDSVTRVEPST